MLEETNKLRRNQGLGILKEDAVVSLTLIIIILVIILFQLEKNAQKWADYLTKGQTCNRSNNHQNPFPFPEGAENIFYFGGYAGTGKIAVDEWYNKSPRHRFNVSIVSLHTRQLYVICSDDAWTMDSYWCWVCRNLQKARPS